MLPALHFTRSTRILGCFASGGLYSYLTFALAALVIAVNIVLVVEFVDVMPVGAVVADRRPAEWMVRPGLSPDRAASSTRHRAERRGRGERARGSRSPTRARAARRAGRRAC